MAANTDGPVEGNWYELPSGEIFTVVTIDEHDGMVEIQYDDSTLEDIELESWEDLGADPIDPPDEWAGGYGSLEDDLDLDVTPEDIEED